MGLAARFLALLSLVATIPAFAGEVAAGCTRVENVPYIVKAPGRYCLARDVETPSFGFMIEADDVEIDLGGHRIRGPLNPATYESCIVSYGYRHITVRNGAVEGCAMGVFLSDSYDRYWEVGLPGGHHRVEDMDVSRSFFRGIRVEGNANLVRRNVVRHIGGSTAYPVSHILAIESVGPGTVIEGNFVHEARGMPGFEGVGISVSDFGSSTSVRNNFISMSAIDHPVGRGAWPNVGRSTWGIWIGGVWTRGLVAEGNIIVNAAYGITVHRSSHAILARNTVAGAIVPYYLPTLTGTPLGVLSDDNICDKTRCLETVEQYYIIP
jgi:hypothetical protein